MKYLFILSLIGSVLTATAQSNNIPSVKTAGNDRMKGWASDVIDKYGILESFGWAVEVNMFAGALTKDLTTSNSSSNYLNGVNVNQGTLKFQDGTSLGFDVQLGYFFGKKRNWGIGLGVMYLSQAGNLNLENYHAEYQSVDYNGNIFRQIVNPTEVINEQLKISNINIPLLLKYKSKLAKRWGISADAGLLYNVQMINRYSTNASFNYEAAYEIVTQPGGSLLYLYDNSPTPKIGDHLITKDFVNSVYPGKANEYFASQRELGASVGLGVKPNNNSGNVSYSAGSIGLFLQPSIDFYITPNIAMKLGAYYMYQNVNNTPQKGYQLTNKIGDYSSSLNNISKEDVQSYGGNIGIRFMFGGKKFRPVISAEEAIEPTICGASDGMIILHTFVPNSVVKINYRKNGTVQPVLTCVAEQNGTIRIPNLSPGEYTDITATTSKGVASGSPIELQEHQISVSSVIVTKPSQSDVCTGAVTLKGLTPEELVSVNFDYNGVPNPPLYSKVYFDSSLVLRGLCAGSYSHIKISVGKCATTIADFNLDAPMLPVAVEKDNSMVISPIYFEVDKSIVHESYFPVLEKAINLLNKSKNNFIVIEGHADTTGFSQRNQQLSLSRAYEVRAYLLEMGVSADRIKIVTYSDKKPVANNNTVQGRALNRRVLLHIQQ